MSNYALNKLVVALLFTLLSTLGLNGMGSRNLKCLENSQEDNIEKTVDQFSIIPKPTSIVYSNQYFTFNKETQICFNSESISKEAFFFQEKLEGISNCKIKMPAISDKKNIEGNVIRLTISPKGDLEENQESYRINIAENEIEILAPSPKGIFYGIQSLLQILPTTFLKSVKIKSVKIKTAIINDEPYFPWRGLLLDCCRHFMEKDFVKRYIDLLAFYKMNTLHWHLTEDQGWRIEIDQYPKLTEIAAWRIEKDGSRYGGFYSKEDIREIVAYAESNHINIIPEIELPGHSQAALAAYPEFSCTGGPFKVETEWGVFREIYCAGNEATFMFLENVIDEVLELFPSKYIHIGGDEAPKYRWENCSKCQNRIKKENLKDEHELQSYFIKRIAQYLESKDRILVGWDEILEGGLAENAMIQSWRGFDGATEAANHDHYAVVSPTSHAYFDYDLKAIDLEKVYSFDPIPKDLNPGKEKYILGGECNMWSERAPQEKVDSKVFPRILAMSEVLWSYPHKQKKESINQAIDNGNGFDEFHQRVQNHYPILDEMKVDYGLEKTPISLTNQLKAEKKSIQCKLTPANEQLKLFYTMDGTEPNIYSLPYQDEILIDQSLTIKARAFKGEEALGKVTIQKFHLHNNLGQSVEYKFQYSPFYTGGGISGLSNGLKGGLDFRDGNWQGFQFDNVHVTTDLGSVKSINKVTSSYYQYNNSWIFLPTEVIYQISSDGITFTNLATIKNETDPKTRGKFIQDFVAEFTDVKARYVRLVAKNIQNCPDWHEAAGSKAWLFIDEIGIE